jgi:hypothetical protein
MLSPSCCSERFAKCKRLHWSKKTTRKVVVVVVVITTTMMIMITLVEENDKNDGT